MIQIAQRTVGELVADNPLYAAVFKRRGIDFCCGGGRTVEDACDRAGIPLDELTNELLHASEQQTPGATPPPDTSDWSLDFLTRYIENVHHTYVRRQLPLLTSFTEKMARRHGDSTPDLLRIRDLVQTLATELSRHLEDEEGTLFPLVRDLEAGRVREVDTDTLLADLEDDHAEAGEAFRTLRALTDDFTPPSGACTTWRAAYAELEAFEDDLHRHVHLENNVLFPQLAARLGRTHAPA